MSPRILAAGGLGGVALASGVALTATSGWLVVRAAERPVILTLLTAIVAVRTFGMARPVFRYWERLRSHDAALDDLATARTRLYAALLPLTPARLPRRGRAAVLAGVVDDLSERVEAQVRVSVPLLTSALAGLATVGLCTWVEPAAGAVVAALLLVAAFTTLLAGRLEARSMDDLGTARGELARVTELVASQALELQAVGAGAAARGWVADAQRQVAHAGRRQSRGRAIATGMLPLSTAIATVACAVVAGRSGHGGPVSALLVLAPYALAEVFGALPEAARAHARAAAAGRRLDALLDERPAVSDPLHEPLLAKETERRTGCNLSVSQQRLLAKVAAGGGRRVPHLRLRGIGASWDGRRAALAGADLEVAPGQVVAVTGPSGSGKSTLLAVVARQLDPTAGRYLVDGRDALRLSLAEVRQLFAIVDDDPHVFATTLRANLHLARPAADDPDLTGALAAAGLGDWFASLPDGLDTRLGAGSRGLSGGERARLSIARALLSGRPVLLLDEPVAHLDHPTAVAVMRDLLAARADRSVVVVSHRPEGLADAHGIIDLAAAAPSPANGPSAPATPGAVATPGAAATPGGAIATTSTSTTPTTTPTTTTTTNPARR
ncbi:ATP-binding cassette, subfamily C, CydC [Pedococcus dokdonensis]|uniref:ATP-binding cassette, subfamily C, CydC n=1 Tax=Pedococcus dokdonensis TaxID=443156 RepID=A0A1H0TT48_9MICO|nr:thiol reductant ABC exporter subunit CydC [Pedococcus dokdonensis]SDP57262.1 ATP-binding cassette, subfamily C, CydC [Pedococcus dokdonensis]